MSDPVFDVLTELASCLCEQIRKDDLPEPCFCGVLPGQLVAYDYVGVCEQQDGMAWTRLATSYPAAGVGRVDQNISNCGSGIGVEIELGVLRQAPTLQEGGEPPTEAMQLESVRVQMGDMLAMWRAVNCCFSEKGTDYILQGYRPFGPQGFAVGGSFTVMVAL